MPQVRLALTLDDAPTIAEASLAQDPSNMDAIRETLKSSGVKHCVAFVVARTAAGHEGALERWLDDGYELGNHTFDHPRASEVGVDRFLRSVRLCHELLTSVGAFANKRTAWFRFPYLNRGRDPAARSAIQAECEGLGYRLAHASVDLCDHRFEHKLGRATRRADTAMAAAIGARYEDVALQSIRFADARMQHALARAVPLIAYCHFGRASRLHLAGILERLGSSQTEFCTLEEALADPTYRDFDRDHERDGLVIHSLRRPLTIDVARRLAGLSEVLGIANQTQLGPRWPYIG